MLIGDSRRFKQILVNLVKNALKFTKQGFIKLKIYFDDQAQNLIVHVLDTGVGIAAEDFQKIFK